MIESIEAFYLKNRRIVIFGIPFIFLFIWSSLQAKRVRCTQKNSADECPKSAPAEIFLLIAFVLSIYAVAKNISHRNDNNH